MAAIGGASEKKVRCVAAGDEQDESDCCKQKQHQRAYRAEDVLREGLDEADPSVSEGASVMQRIEARHDGAQLDLSFFERDAWFEARERVAAGVVTVGFLLRGECGGGPELCGFNA